MAIFLSLIMSLFSFFSFFKPKPAPLAVPQSLYDFTMKSIDGKDVPLSDYRGKVVLVVNVASNCGLTPQYNSLQKLYSDYEKQGLVVLGFPANNFLGQEPGTDQEIKTFCTNKYDVTFPMFSKISVKGSNIHPLYEFLTLKAYNGVLDAPVTWNFQKFLINKQGEVVTSFSPRTKVDEAEVLAQIMAELQK